MAIDILSIEPSVISRDLKGKYVLLYGKAKSGKTTAAASFPKALLCAFERGYNALGGIKAADIMKWSDFKNIVKQLEKPAAREMYDTIIIDTISIAWQLCEQFICSQNNVQAIADVAWGQGYAAQRKEFESTLRKITQLGYGIVLIAHDEIKTVKDSEGNDVEKIGPELPKRAAEICNGLVDIIGYIGVEFDKDGKSSRWMYTRETPTLFAGSRFKYLAPKIPFGYDSLVNAISEAIETSEKKDGIKIVDRIENTAVEDTLSYDELREEAKNLWAKLTTTGDDEKNHDMGNRVAARIENIFGRSMKLSEITENQVDLFALVVDEMRDMVDQYIK